MALNTTGAAGGVYAKDRERSVDGRLLGELG